MVIDMNYNSKRIKNIIGERHRMLEVISNSGELFRDGSVLWNCKCDCGNIVKLTSHQFYKERVSCGCYRAIKDRCYNTYDILGDITLVFDNKNNFTIIDSKNLELIKPYYWFKGKNGYFVSVTHTKKSKRLRLHNFIYGIEYIPSGYELDHKNRKKHDNRLKNLRLATRAENNINHGLSKANTSGYVGVSYMKNKNKYRAYITVNNKQINLGLHNSLEEAYKVRLEAERKYFGEFSSKGR